MERARAQDHLAVRRSTFLIGFVSIFLSVHDATADSRSVWLWLKHDLARIHSAVAAGDTTNVRSILDQSPSVVDTASFPFKWTPLHFAVDLNSSFMVELLLSYGATTTARAFTDSARMEQVALARTVPTVLELRFGSEQWETPLDMALRLKHWTCAGKLLSREWLPLHCAVLAGDVDGVRGLMAQGVDPNARVESDLLSRIGGGRDLSPLHLATFRGDTAIAHKLIAGGADLEGRTTSYEILSYRTVRTKSWTARRPEHVEEREVLPEFLTRNWGSGWTALHLAAWFGDLAMVDLLVRNGADLGAKTTKGKTSLRLAKDRELKDVVARLRKPKR